MYNDEKIYALYYKDVFYICDKTIPSHLIEFIKSDDEGYYIENEILNDMFFELEFKVRLMKINEEIYYYISPLAKQPGY